MEIKNADQSLLVLDTDGDGIISREEMHAHSKFSQVIAGIIRKNPPVNLEVTNDCYIQPMLHKFDTVGDGRLSQREIMTPRMFAILHIIDLNGDGFSTVDELELINDSVRNHTKSSGGGPNP